MIAALDEATASEVAAAHRQAPRVGGPLAHAAYAQLAKESDRLFQLITRGRRPVRIIFTRAQAPYGSADELIASLREHHELEITTAARERDRRHPVLGCEQGGPYDRFRAVHDVLGHGHLAVGFDRDGEYLAWRYQERFHSPLARRALATELHGEHSVRWTTGDLPEHKAVVLDQRVVERSRAGQSAGGRHTSGGRRPDHSSRLTNP